ncbi:MAG: Na+/H+ antiporter subunit E [Proteobacteria bacterium]|nr:Na+/H+ antiporter subunit E [Pseudomonadota bacterium]
MRFLVSFFILFIFWFLLSGETNLILIISGIISSLLVSYLSYDMLISKSDLRRNIIMYLKFIKYIPYLIFQIILANIDVIYRVLHPKLPIDPVVINFKTKLDTEFCIVAYANSITLTPGTVTIDANKSKDFIVHALHSSYAHSLLSGEMEKRIKELENV